MQTKRNFENEYKINKIKRVSNSIRCLPKRNSKNSEIIQQFKRKFRQSFKRNKKFK